VLLFWDGESSVIYLEASGVPRGNSLKVEDAHRLDFYICEANARNFGQIALFSRLNVENRGIRKTRGSFNFRHKANKMSSAELTLIDYETELIKLAH
jgi:hypothetical protein